MPSLSTYPGVYALPLYLPGWYSTPSMLPGWYSTHRPCYPGGCYTSGLLPGWVLYLRLATRVVTMVGREPPRLPWWEESLPGSHGGKRASQAPMVGMYLPVCYPGRMVGVYLPVYATRASWWVYTLPTMMHLPHSGYTSPHHHVRGGYLVTAVRRPSVWDDALGSNLRFPLGESLLLSLIPPLCERRAEDGAHCYSALPV